MGRILTTKSSSTPPILRHVKNAVSGVSPSYSKAVLDTSVIPQSTFNVDGRYWKINTNTINNTMDIQCFSSSGVILFSIDESNVNSVLPALFNVTTGGYMGSASDSCLYVTVVSSNNKEIHLIKINESDGAISLVWTSPSTGINFSATSGHRFLLRDTDSSGSFIIGSGNRLTVLDGATGAIQMDVDTSTVAIPSTFGYLNVDNTISIEGIISSTATSNSIVTIGHLSDLSNMSYKQVLNVVTNSAYNLNFRQTPFGLMLKNATDETPLYMNNVFVYNKSTVDKWMGDLLRYYSE